MSVAAGPEHTKKNELTEWLHQHGIKVFWEESNPWNHPTFTAHGSGGKPDLIIETGDMTLVAEFKPGESVSGLYDATLQTHRYWRQISTGNLRLKIGSTSVRVDGVVTASGRSEQGQLFPHWAEVMQRPEDYDDSRRYCSRTKQLPKYEFRMTEQHIRLLWRLSKRDDIEIDEPPYIGGLLSTRLDKDDEYRPAVLWNEGDANQNWEVFE